MHIHIYIYILYIYIHIDICMYIYVYASSPLHAAWLYTPHPRPYTSIVVAPTRHVNPPHIPRHHLNTHQHKRR